MKSLTLCTLLLLAALPAAAGETAPAAGSEDDGSAVEHRRVVVRVTDDASEDGYSYTFVDGDDGEPVVVGSFLADRGYLGIGMLDLTPELRRHFGTPGDNGILISKVEPESPAAAADLRAGDILLSVDGNDVGSAAQVAHRIFQAEEGDVVGLELWRDGALVQATATLARRERRQVDLGGLMWAPEVHDFHGVVPGEGLPLIEIDPESMGEALSRAREQLESPAWRERLERMGSHRLHLEERIEQLEQRLESLQEELEGLEERREKD